MSNRTINLSDDLHAYLLRVSLREADVARRLRERTKQLPDHNMQIAPEQGQFMALLARLIGARRCLEIGTFTGYSALCVGMALPDDGRIVACDVSEDFTAVGKPFWDEAGIAGKIDLRIGPALKTLDALIEDGGGDLFDFAFIDADKTNYAGYVDRCHALVRPGGLIAIDNVLWDGAVVDETKTDADTQAIRDLNAALHADARFELSLVPIGDGLTLLRRL
jgi:predicted O-methyltransferase YrrM